MGYPLRTQDPSAIFFVTIRTEGQAFYLRPSKDVNETIGGIIARYQEIFGIEIFCFVIMSNHMHFVLKAPHGRLDEFMENVNREIARRINHKLKRRGKFWSHRYRAQVILDDSDLIEAFLYTVTNPVKHGGAVHSKDWPGLCSYNQNITERKITYSFIHHSQIDKEKRITYHDLVITPLPQFKEESKDNRIRKIFELLEVRIFNLVKSRSLAGRGFLSLDKVKAISPFDTPSIKKYSSAGSCYSKNPTILREHKRSEAYRRMLYTLASRKFRLGLLNTVFPEFTFKPSLSRKPRSKPFVLLPDNYFFTSCSAVMI